MNLEITNCTKLLQPSNTSHWQGWLCLQKWPMTCQMMYHKCTCTIHDAYVCGKAASACIGHQIFISSHSKNNTHMNNIRQMFI